MKHIYQSIAAFDDTVYKYQGMVAADKVGFYSDHYSSHLCNGRIPATPGKSNVLVFDEYKGDRIRENGEVFNG